MQLQNLPISAINPSPMNPRKTFDQTELDELADNIRQQGLLQPITVRPISEGYEIVCGERRYRACKAIDPSGTIAANVREMSDDEAFFAMITENLQRKDVNPIEEAYAFQQLVEKGCSVEEIAVRFGKTVRFVQDRIKLNSLIPELLLMVKEEKMPLSAAMLLAKTEEANQKKFANDVSNRDYVPKSTALGFVNGLFKTLANTPWAKDGVEFDGGCGVKCSACQHNSSNAGCLFYEMKSSPKDAKCTCQSKFDDKQLAYLKASVQKIEHKLVKKGGGIESGKAIIVDPGAPYYGSKELYLRAKQLLDEMGIEVFISTNLRRCWYGSGDERVKQMLESGEIIEAYSYYNNYNCLQLEVNYFYTDSEGSSGAKDTTLEAVSKTRAYHLVEETARKSMATKLQSSIVKMPVSSKPLTETEEVALLSLLMAEGPNELIGMCCLKSRRDVFAFVKNHREQWGLILRETLRHKLKESFAYRVEETAINVTSALAKYFMPQEYEKARAKVEAEVEKKQAKIEAELNALGYDVNGKKLER